MNPVVDQLALVTAKHAEISELNNEVEALKFERDQLRHEIVNLKKLNDSFAITAEANQKAEAQKRDVRLRKSNSLTLGYVL